MRKTGHILLDLEVILDELADQELQTGDILSLVYSHLVIHRPDCMEEYEDGTNPIYYYGPPEGIPKTIKKQMLHKPRRRCDR